MIAVGINYELKQTDLNPKDDSVDTYDDKSFNKNKNLNKYC